GAIHWVPTVVGLLCYLVSADADKITTIKEVSVREGQSIIIPCLYDPIYESHLKYLCSGYMWAFCKPKVYSKPQETNSNMCITDDRERRTINVTMNALSSSEAGHYWCCIEIDKASDKGSWFKLQVTKDPELYVENQTVTGDVGQNVSIFCHHPHHHSSNEEMKWCKLGGNCVENTGTLDRASVQLTKTDKILKIEMSNLMMKHTGWYYCSVGHLQMPVHVSVTNISNTLILRTMKQATNNPAPNNTAPNNTAPNNTLQLNFHSKRPPHTQPHTLLHTSVRDDLTVSCALKKVYVPQQLNQPCGSKLSHVFLKC
uniref:Ig-like domain-containing protein n=1 Tax=Astyanax mexicanus TaxID=7994 RepID=A0A8B9L112_ASTMX